MYNWNTDTKILRKNPGKYAIWRIEQLINFGLDKEKLDAKLVKRYWNKLRIDPKRRNALAFLLWQRQS